jgi:hypothetical protein
LSWRSWECPFLKRNDGKADFLATKVGASKRDAKTQRKKMQRIESVFYLQFFASFAALRETLCL